MVIALSCACASLAVAQDRARRSCPVSDANPWVQRQALWLDESKHEWTNDTLRTALLEAAGLKAPLRAPVQWGVRVEGRPAQVGATADAMTEQLKKMAAVRGSPWPTKSAVGAAGAHAVFVLAARDTALGRMAMHRLMEAGPDESLAADVATLEDQQRLLMGRKQIYGTQFEKDASGKVVLRAMEDSAHADLRREGAGLPPFKLGLCFAGSGG
jgi:hypothetical protein